jgi:hypothetical protein
VFEHEPGEESCVHCGEIWFASWWLVTETFLEVLEILELRDRGDTRRYLHYAPEVGRRRKAAA